MSRSPTEISLLAFEGGGGKGVTFLGAIRAMEDLGLLPITASSSPIRGISGASAGAITALFVAMGLSSKELGDLINKLEPISGHFFAPQLYTPKYVSPFEAFMDYPESNLTFDPKELYQKGSRNHYQRAIKTIGSATYSSYYHEAKISPDSIGELKIAGAIEAINYFEVFDELHILNRLTNYLGTTEKERGSLRLLNYYVGSYFALNLIYQKGFFTGIGIRQFFGTVISYWLNQKFPLEFKKKTRSKTPADFTFLDFKDITGIHLAITGSNIVTNRPFVFSVETSPNFPVVEAVQISMNIPILYKPILITNGELAGEWVDGGVLNNLPIHAFDTEPDGKINPRIVGFRLQDGDGHESSNDPKGDHLFSAPNTPQVDEPLPIAKAIGQLLYTFMYPSEEGQIRTPEERKMVVPLYTYDLSTTDFTPTATQREKPIKEAYKATMKYFGRQ